MSKLEAKTFYHFDASVKDELNLSSFSSIDQVIGHYIAKQYHSQFNSSRQEIYTFIEKYKVIVLFLIFMT